VAVGYIRGYLDKEKVGVTGACIKVLDQMCRAVARVLDTAERMKQAVSTATVSAGVEASASG
jgi:hypothetical protein